MEDLCAPTLEALDEFLSRQKALLARTQSDIERLRQLKKEVVEDPEGFVGNVGERLNDRAFRISEQTDYALHFPKPIQWEVFQGIDPTPLRDLHTQLTQTTLHRARPQKSQRAPLSELQSLVKTARKAIVDPVFEEWGEVSEPECDAPGGPNSTSASSNLSDAEAMRRHAEAMRRQREQEKIRELKKRQIRGGYGYGYGGGGGVRGGLSLPTTSMMGLAGQGWAGKGTEGVFIRRDVEDESLEVVDISDEGDPPPVVGGDAGGGKRLWAGKGAGKGMGKGKHCYAAPPTDGTADAAEDDEEGMDLEVDGDNDHHAGYANGDVDASPYPVPPAPPDPTPDNSYYDYEQPKSSRTRRSTRCAAAAAATTPKQKTKAKRGRPPKRKVDDDDAEYGGGYADPGEGDVDEDVDMDLDIDVYCGGGGGGGKTISPISSRTGSTQSSKSISKSKTQSNSTSTSTTNGQPKKPKRDKPKPETYKQAWSVEEQHLLERLLEEIPDGEKFRWQKISRAMGGRRTPRQVASRVQKYFEKLKRFGVEPG
ncbi:hypothetical protein CC2G_014563 [Coprinopsis cinerea AmutBmut pab1-1]|nr:hypothetical protein CC2G_014563 [Coprinopsis cinerea AmutBmut pab1-1]